MAEILYEGHGEIGSAFIIMAVLALNAEGLYRFSFLKISLH